MDTVPIGASAPPPAPPPAPRRADERPPVKRVLFSDAPPEFAAAVRLLSAARFLALVAVSGLTIAVLDSTLAGPWTACKAENAAQYAAMAANRTRTWCGEKSCGSPDPPSCYEPGFPLGFVPFLLLVEVAASVFHALSRFFNSKLQSPLDACVPYPWADCYTGARSERRRDSALYPSQGRGALVDCLSYVRDATRNDFSPACTSSALPASAAFFCAMESGMVAARYGGLAATAASPLPGQVALNWATGLAWALAVGGYVGPPLFFQCLWLRLRQGDPAQAVRLVDDSNNAPAEGSKDSILLA